MIYDILNKGIPLFGIFNCKSKETLLPVAWFG